MPSDLSQIDQLPFWQRQFAPRATAAQTVFDVAFGIALPLACLYLDPIVFKSSFDTPLLGRYAVVAGVAIGLGFLSLTAWLLVRWPAGLLAGTLAGAALFAMPLGIVLLPFSVIGLPIGLLGLSPFATAFVFFRNAVRAARVARQRSGLDHFWIAAILGLAISCVGPWAMHGYVRHKTSKAMAMLASADSAEARRGVWTLNRMRFLVDFDRVVNAYATETDPVRRERLAVAYRELTGDDIEHRLSVLRD